MQFRSFGMFSNCSSKPRMSMYFLLNSHGSTSRDLLLHSQSTGFLTGDAMIRAIHIVKHALCFSFLAPFAAMASENPFVTVNDVTWTELGHNENDSMPIGNGDLAANVWTEQNGDLMLLVAKADAWTEL